MSAFAFYEAGCDDVRGKRRITVPLRRLLRRLLRPIFLRLRDQLDSLDRRQDRLERDLKAIEAMGWDHVAMSRRLAMLEDHIEALLANGTVRDATPTPEGDQRSMVRYPRLGDSSIDDETRRGDGPRAAVC